MIYAYAFYDQEGKIVGQRQTGTSQTPRRMAAYLSHSAPAGANRVCVWDESYHPALRIQDNETDLASALCE